MKFKKILCAALSTTLIASFVPSVMAQNTLQDSIIGKIETQLLFENNFNDEKGNNTPTVKGTSPTFTDGQSGSGALFKTNGGYLDFTNYISTGTSLKNKSVAFSLKSNKLHPSYDPAIFGNKNWDSATSPGFVFAYEYNRPGSYKARIADGSANNNAVQMGHAAQVWQNYVVSFDENAKEVRIYCNGELIRTISASSLSANPYENSAYSLKLGNDGTGSYSKNKTVDYEFVVDNFIVTSSLLTDDEVSELHNMQPLPTVTQNMTLKTVAADNVAAAGYINLNMYALGTISDTVKTLEFDVEYDPSMLTYDRAQFNNATVTETEPGKLHIVDTKAISSTDITNYSATRFTQLVFKTADVGEVSDALISFTNTVLKNESGDVVDSINVKTENPTVTIHPKKEMDLNGDGMIGIGDIALADENQKSEIADVSKIYPYKRAIAITIDGAGRSFAETSAPYNGQGLTSSGAVVPGAGLENVRNNPYCMDLFNNQMATSTSAISMDPPISAQNYCSILHGKKFSNLPSAYKFTNDLANSYQWPDYGLETPQIPSFLKSINAQDPSRKLYSYAEWAPITNGIIEQNSGTYVDYLYGAYCFDRLASYVNEGKLKDTTVSYMQSDVMDHYGHDSGYFTDGYYELLQKYDEFFPTLINAMKSQNVYDDTLLIVNADHGGHNYWNTTNKKTQGTHTTYSNIDDRGVFISVGGQSVNKGAKLTGGENDDIAALIFEGLRMDKPSSMTDSAQFDSSMFLSQEELSSTGRDIEKITAEESNGIISLSLSNAKNSITAADVIIDSDVPVSNVSVKDGVTLLRNTFNNGKTYLTFSFASTPSSIGDITFVEDPNGRAKLDEVMLADALGNEIYCDIENNIKSGRALEIWDKLSPYGALNSSNYDETVSKGYKFKNDSVVLSESELNAVANVTYGNDCLVMTKKSANQRIDFETTFESRDQFSSNLYKLELDIEQVNGAPMYISTRWRNFLTLNWLADGSIDVNAGKATLTGYKNKRVKFEFVLDYENKYIDIYADGALKVEKCPLRTDASAPNSPSKPLTLNINITSAGAVNSGMKLYSLGLTENYTDTFKITDASGDITDALPGSEVMAIADKSLYSEDAKIYLAAYGENGELQNISITKLSALTNTATDLMTVPENGSVKAFLWDKNMNPIIEQQ